jgi:hypothetical protein
LFEVLDELAEKIEVYEAFIKKMFDVYYQDQYGYSNIQSEAVYPFNIMVQRIERHVNDSEWNDFHSEWYRLVIYLFELDSWAALELYDKFYSASPEAAVSILAEMNQHKSCLVLCNVKEILAHLKENKQNDLCDHRIEQLYQENSFCQDRLSDMELFSKLLFK